MVQIVGEVDGFKVYYDESSGKFVAPDVEVYGDVRLFKADTVELLQRKINDAFNIIEKNIMERVIGSLILTFSLTMLGLAVFSHARGIELMSALPATIPIIVSHLLAYLLAAPIKKKVKVTYDSKLERKSRRKNILLLIATTILSLTVSILGWIIYRKRKK